MATTYMAIATVAIAVATVVNVILFCVFQHKQTKYVKVDMALQYVRAQLERLEKCKADLTNLGKKCVAEGRGPVASKLEIEELMQEHRSAVRIIKRAFTELGAEDLLEKLTGQSPKKKELDTN